MDIRKGYSGRVKTKLDPAEVGQLRGMLGMPGYQIVLDILESTCIMQETALLRVTPGDTKKIIAMHSKAQVAWEMFEDFQKRIAGEIQLMNEADAAALRDTPLTEDEKLDREIAEIVDPTRRTTYQ